MQPRIRERYSDAILHQAMRRYAIAPEQIRQLDAFESFIYEFQRGGQPYILRLSHTLHRSEELIQGEVDWINYLAQQGISVARAIDSDHNKLVEAIDDEQGGAFLATAFVKAPGRPPASASWTAAQYRAYGQLIGSMHAATMNYRPANPAWKRPEWDDPAVELVERCLPASEVGAREAYRAAVAYLRGLPKTRSSYGIIHQDAHMGNFFIDDANRITLFDFDDCGYSWFINDIALVVFYSSIAKDDPAAHIHTFLPDFLRGYRQFQPLQPEWLGQIAWFVKLRELELYAVIHRDFDLQAIDNAWCASFMRGRKQRIEQNVPVFDIDFESFSKHV